MDSQEPDEWVQMEPQGQELPSCDSDHALGSGMSPQEVSRCVGETASQHKAAQRILHWLLGAKYTSHKHSLEVKC